GRLATRTNEATGRTEREPPPLAVPVLGDRAFEVVRARRGRRDALRRRHVAAVVVGRHLAAGVVFVGLAVLVAVAVGVLPTRVARLFLLVAARLLLLRLRLFFVVLGVALWRRRTGGRRLRRRWRRIDHAAATVRDRLLARRLLRDRRAILALVL